MSDIESALAPAWIANRYAAAAFCRAALNHTTVALDTEFIRTQTYFAELGLIQLAIPGQIVLVDPLISGVAAELNPLMQAQTIKIVHSASEDLEVLGHTLGHVPEPLFDTQIAALLCGYELPPSYQKLVQAELGIALDEHGKMPDVILFDRARRWLFLVEAVTSHGPIDGKRHDELRRLFGGANAGLVYVTAFLERKALQKDFANISWETEVWIAEAPSHLIHFDGERFLGPYPDG